MHCRCSYKVSQMRSAADGKCRNGSSATARTALNGQADGLESVELLALTPHAELPVPAQERLKIREGQANALIRLVLRPLTRTMTDLQANQIRDDVYLALHEGPVKELIEG